MKRLIGLAAIVTACAACAARAEGLETPPARAAGSGVETPAPAFLEQDGLAGMCRGGYRIVCAPALIPYTFALGLSVPFRSDPEMGGTTNYVWYAAAQTVAGPAAVAANTVSGAGGCCFEVLSGVADIVSLGYFGVRDREHRAPIDYRPYLLQLIARQAHERLSGGEQHLLARAP